MSQKREDIPKYALPIVETHCHLDYLKDRDIGETLRLCRLVGVGRLVTISVSADNLDTVLDLAKRHEGVYCSQGIHPHEAKEWSDEVEGRVRRNAGEGAVVAVGEIGLDFYYDKSPRPRQREAFERQMEIASQMGLPVIIHSRQADRETEEVLENYGGRLARRGVIHSFTSGEGLAKKALSLGFYLGFNGIITFKNAQNVRNIVRLCPLEQMLLETDAPFLTPVPYRGRENAPFYLPFVARKIAEIKNIPVEEVIKTTSDNAIAHFGLSD